MYIYFLLLAHSIHNLSFLVLWLIVEIDARAGKRARLQLDGSDYDYDMDEDLQTIQRDDASFEELCGDATFNGESSAPSETELGSWGLLDGHMLARVFHFLRSDMKSLVFASLTCKHWRAAASFYKDISRQVDLSHLGPNCSDLIMWNIMVSILYVLLGMLCPGF